MTTRIEQRSLLTEGPDRELMTIHEEPEKKGKINTVGLETLRLLNGPCGCCSECPMIKATYSYPNTHEEMYVGCVKLQTFLEFKKAMETLALTKKTHTEELSCGDVLVTS